jgi:translation initiation factor 3 subunit K
MKDDEMNKLIKSKNWKKLEDNFVFVANHEESIKTKNIVEKIKFEGNFYLKNKKKLTIYN